MKDFTYKWIINLNLVVLLFILSSIIAHATVVTERWTADVSFSFNTSGYVRGDKVSWTVTYDNESTVMHEYLDGANGSSDKGLGDDTIKSKQCTSASTAAGCTSYVNNDYTLISDAIIDIDSIYNQLLTGSSIVRTRDINNSNRMQRITFRDNSFIDIKSDEIFFNAATSTNLGALFINGFDNTDTFVQSYILLNPVTFILDDTIINNPRNPVPEPSVIPLMGLGLLGLGVFRRKVHR